MVKDKKKAVIISVMPGVKKRRYDSDLRLLRYYRQNYSKNIKKIDVDISTTKETLVLPNETSEDKKRIERVVEHYFPYVKVYELAENRDNYTPEGLDLTNFQKKPKKIKKLKKRNLKRK